MSDTLKRGAESQPDLLGVYAHARLDLALGHEKVAGLLDRVFGITEMTPEQRKARDAIEASVAEEERQRGKARDKLRYARERLAKPDMGGLGTLLLDLSRSLVPGTTVVAAAEGGMDKAAGPAIDRLVAAAQRVGQTIKGHPKTTAAVVGLPALGAISTKPDEGKPSETASTRRLYDLAHLGMVGTGAAAGAGLQQGRFGGHRGAANALVNLSGAGAKSQAEAAAKMLDLAREQPELLRRALASGAAMTGQDVALAAQKELPGLTRLSDLFSADYWSRRLGRSKRLSAYGEPGPLTAGEARTGLGTAALGTPEAKQWVEEEAKRLAAAGGTAAIDPRGTALAALRREGKLRTSPLNRDIARELKAIKDRGTTGVDLVRRSRQARKLLRDARHQTLLEAAKKQVGRVTPQARELAAQAAKLHLGETTKQLPGLLSRALKGATKVRGGWRTGAALGALLAAIPLALPKFLKTRRTRASGGSAAYDAAEEARQALARAKAEQAHRQQLLGTL